MDYRRSSDAHGLRTERPGRDQPSFARRAPARRRASPSPSSGAASACRRRRWPSAWGASSATGVITGYRAVVDPRAIGFPLAAVVRVRPFARQLHKIPELAERTPEVVECERITGEDCFLLRLHVRAIDDLEAVLDHFTPVRADDDVDRPLLAGAAAVAAAGVGRAGVRAGVPKGGLPRARGWPRRESAGAAEPPCSPPRSPRPQQGPAAPLANHDRGCTTASA